MFKLASNFMKNGILKIFFTKEIMDRNFENYRFKHPVLTKKN